MTKVPAIVLTLAVVAALLLIFAGPGTRFGFWEFGTGFLLMRLALFAGLVAAALALMFLIIPKTRRGQSGILVAALIVGLGTAWVPWKAYLTVHSLPFIHDITTDTERPPRFVDLVPLRADAPNPPEYPGEETAAQQREAYPDIMPLEAALSADQIFRQALETARDQGWEIVAAVPEEGRIEAIATTFWFGFKDDVVIRITPAQTGAILDVRSKSRVGRSDVGANAERIRDFMRELKRRS